VIITLFLAGPIGPELNVWGLHKVSPVWFLLKLLLFLFAYVWVRASLPRFRYDQLMEIGWKRLIPLSLGWLLLIAGLRVADDEGWNRPLVIVIGLLSGLLCWGVLELASRVGLHRRMEDEAAGEVRF
jgi:NADH-quinone oxidoreductase subunit H